MTISRKTRFWLIITAIPIVLLIAGIITLKVMFTSERLKSMVIPRLEETTGRQVAINNISLNVFPSIAVSIEGLSISNRKGEGFSPSPFLTLDALRLNVKLLPLLRSQIEVTSLEINRPHILLEVNARNETNYANLTEGGGAVDAPRSSNQRNPEPPGSPSHKIAEPSSSSAAFLISNLQVRNGALDYVNLKDKSATRVRNLSLAMGLGEEGNKTIITGNAWTDSLSYGTVEAPMFEGLRLRLDHRVSYDLSKDLLMIEKGDMTFQDMRLVLSGKVSNVRSSSNLDLTVGSDSLNIADLLSLVPREFMKQAEGVKGTGTAQVHIAVTGTLTDSTSAEYTGTVTAQGASIRYPQLPKPISDIAILSHFTKTKTRQEFRIENLTARLGGAPVRLAMTVMNFDDPYFTLAASGSLNLATVPEYYPLEKGTELGGGMNLDLRIAGKVSDPKTLRASGSMTFLEVSAKTATTSTPVRKVNGTITFTNDIAETKKLSLVIGASDLTLACRVKNYLSLVSTEKNVPQSTASITLQSNHIFTRDIMSESPAPAAGGQKSGSGEPGLPESQNVGPKAQAKSGTSDAKRASPLSALDMDVKATIGTLTLEKFEFTNVRGSVHISKGVVTMQNLAFNAFGGSVVSNGSLDLSKADRPLFDLTLNMNALEAGSLLPHFTSFGQRLNGALTMSTSLKGALNDTLGIVPDALQGTGKVGVRNGSLKGVKMNQALASQLNLPDLETIQFKDWGNDFTVQNGRLGVKDLTITALDAQYVVNGSQGLDGTLDYRMALFLPESAGSKLRISGFAGEAVNLFKDQSGRLRLDFNVGGTMDNPKVQLDTEPARKRLEELAKQKLADEKKKLEESLKEKAGDALRKLFKRDKK